MKWIKASERRPDPSFDRKYISRNPDNHSQVMYCYWNDIKTYYEWLDESLPGSAGMREALEAIGDIIKNDEQTNRDQLVMIYDIVTEALSATTGGEKWVSVQDRLPETEGKYLCGTLVKLQSETEPRFSQYVSNFNFYRDSKSGERILDGEDGTGCFMDNAAYAQFPTHWQPLPPSPSKAQQK